MNTLQKAHWDIVEELIQVTGATVVVPIYPLAPEHHYDAAYQVLDAVYAQVLAGSPASKVILAGDSAGGGLALGQALRYRESGIPLPGHIVLFSPWLDVTLSDPQARQAEAQDIMLGVDWLREAGVWWAGNADPKTPLVSPLYGDLKGLPPIQTYIGTHDLFLADSRRLQALIKAAGGKIEHYEIQGGFHVFMGATFAPEAKAVYRSIAKSLVEH